MRSNQAFAEGKGDPKKQISKGKRQISKSTKHDTSWSKMVRERDGQCLYCGRKPPYVLNTHHFLRRGVKATRLMLENGGTLCFQHHTVTQEFSAHKTPEAFRKWFKKTFPDRLKAIEKKAKQQMTEREAV